MSLLPGAGTSIINKDNDLITPNIYDGKVYKDLELSYDYVDLNNNKISYDISNYSDVLNGISYYISPASFNLVTPIKIDGNPSNNKTGVYNNFIKNDVYILSSYILSSIKYKEFDGGLLGQDCEEDFDFNDQTNFIIKQRMSDTYTITAFNVINDIPPEYNFGDIYVKDVVTKKISTFKYS